MNRCNFVFFLVLFVCGHFHVLSQNFRTISPKSNQTLFSSNELVWEEYYFDFDQYIVKLTNSSISIDTAVSNNTLSLNLPQGVYSWKVLIKKNGNFIDSTRLSTFKVFSPNDVDSLSLWLVGDTGIVQVNGSVSNWYDLSDSLHQINQPNNLQQPTLKQNALNNYDAVSFASNQLFGNTGVTIDNINYTISVVYSYNGSLTRPSRTITTSTNWLMGGYTGSYRIYNGSRFISGGSVINNHFVVHTAYSVNDTLSGFLNGMFLNSVDANVAPQNISISKVGGDYFQGDILEIIMVNGSITRQERLNIDQYLMDKYAPPVNLGPNRKVCSFPDSIALGIDYALDYQWSTNDTTDAIQIDSAGKYYVTITDMFGRTSVDSIYFSLDTSDYQLNFSFEDTTICEGDTIHLRTQNFDRFSYNWNTNDTTAAITVADSGQYILTVQNCLNNSTSDTIQVNVNQPRFSLGVDTIACFNEQLTLQPDSTFTNVSYLWSNNQVSTSIFADTSGLYHLKVNDSYGCEFSDSIRVEIDSSLFGLSLGADTSLCSGNRIGLQQSADTISSYLWSTNDTTALLEVNSSGSYHLTVSNGRCQLSDTVQVSIQGQAPQANFTASDFCFMDSVNFSDFSTPPTGDTIVDWKWNFGDQDSAFIPNPTHQYAAVQSYQVLLQVETDKGCIDTAQQTIIIRPNPMADFASFASCSKKYVYFADSSSVSAGNIIGYLWNFGDTAAAVNSSNQPNPRHIYDTLGQYNVWLIVESNYGCKDTAIQLKNINPTPFVEYTFKGNCLNDSVFFKNNTITAGNVEADNFLWIIDGLHFTDENPTIRFLSTGIKEVFFRVTTDSSCYSSITDSIEIFESPTANFSMGEYCIETPFTIQDLSNSQFPITKWRYILNGDTAYQQSPTFTIDSASTYELRLKVLDSNLCADSISRIIKVNSKPIADFIIENNGSGAPYHLLVKNNSIDANDYLWKFGTGDTAQAKVPSYTYADSGNYNLKLIASNTNACSDSMSKTLRVLPFYLDAIIDSLVLIESPQGYLSLQVRLLNAGNTVIDEVSLETDINGEFKFLEKANGPIFKSNSKVFLINASVNLENSIDFVCVKVLTVNGQKDAVLTNNQICEPGFSDEMILNVFPNPTSGQINFEYVLPLAGNVSIQLYDQLGKEISKRELGVQSKGYYFSTFYLSEIKSGIYHYKITYGTEEKTGTFIKQR